MLKEVKKALCLEKTKSFFLNWGLILFMYQGNDITRQI